jgi:hypothetical protein
MTKKDLFRIIIKIFGLYFLIIALFSILPRSISVLFYPYYSEVTIYTIIQIIGIILVIIVLYIFLILKTDKIVELLRLGKGFDDDMINIGELSVNKIVIISSVIIGGFMFVNAIPGFISNIYFAFKTSIEKDIITPKDKINLGISILNMVIGYILIVNCKWVADKLMKEVEKK